MRYTVNSEVMGEVKNMFGGYEIKQDEEEQCACHKGSHNETNGCHTLQREKAYNQQ